MTAFPHQLPSSLTDHDAIVTNDWAAYAGLRRLSDHWSRPAWPDGAEAYYWILALGDQPDLRRRAAELQKALHNDADLAPVPLDLLHLTLLRVSAIEDISQTNLSAIAANATQRLGGSGAIPLAVGPLAGSTGAVRFSVSPWDRIIHIHAELAAAAAACLGERVVADLRPHISIAYNGLHRSAQPVIAAVEELRDERPVEVNVSHIYLVSLRRQGKQYSWMPVHTIFL
ncbi:hypothetical protein Lfu02_00810 [Longispora fulva]|uniref:2'-5' RNA ligase n=1 Tax=Longispora fulva TaxID=619741 RepID=A0A8J7GNN1_9ACTN|nr:2'-5' RNA ligase family protein [Longispora fulva]MBG6136049.1 2'-5' RNA ligase [Longispora fulva]GIG55709.1 hypothetical protein Lfu02_00810 [Longispora fulva]